MKIMIGEKTSYLDFKHSQDSKGSWATEAVLTIDNRSSIETVRGVSLCHRNDTFFKKTGRKIALTRCLQSYLCRDDRRIVWAEYLKRAKV